MPKKGTSKASRKSSSRRRIPSRRRQRLALPPSIPFNRVACNSVIRLSKQISLSEKLLSYVFTVHSLITGWPGLATSFAEIRILKAKVWLIPQYEQNRPGLTCMATIPVGMDTTASNSDFESFSSMAGAIIRRACQVTHGLYRPTEPSERDWFKTDSTKSIFKVCVLSRGLNTTANPDHGLNAEIVVDVHVKARGKGSAKTSLTRSYDQMAI